MGQFLNENFMLYNETGRRLFHTYAEQLPIIDYHCHISPQEIYEDRRFDNISQIWLGGRNPDGTYFGDHYKWRVMRSNGTPEDLVTGEADPLTKFKAFAKALEMAIGNPMYHWCNLELKKYFGVTEPLTEENAEKIYNHCNDMLRHDPKMTVRGLIEQSNVRFVGTTDDPVDDLKWHEKIAADPGVSFQVCPSFRPDKAINIHREGFADYMKQLAQTVDKKSLDTMEDVLDALDQRVSFFKGHGCRATDHGLDYVMYRPCSMEEANRVYQKALKGESLSDEEREEYQTTLLTHLARTYHREGMVMEIHYSCLRNTNARMFAAEGPDTGFDTIAQNDCIPALASLLSDLDETNELPRTILFSLDAADFDRIGAMLGCFQSEEIPSKIQMGAAWWFQDTRDGMEKQMKSLGNLGLLGNFVGMLTDSRSFLSYTRHDYFRRIACNLIGEWVEKGEYPAIESSLKKIVEGISYYNAERYFGIHE